MNIFRKHSMVHVHKLAFGLSVMKLQAIKSIVAVVSLLVLLLLVVTNFCLFNGTCFPYRTAFTTSIVASLEPLGVIDYEDKYFTELPGGLNQHIWENNCVKTIETLCNFPVFPNAPDQRQVISRTEITAPKDAGTDGYRLFGFVFPNSTGEYQFSVASNGFAEIWLSLSKHWKAAKKVAFIRPFDAQYVTKWNFNASETQISTGIHLKAKAKYYIEIMYTLGAHGKTENFLQVAWKRPQESNFKIIGSEYLLMYTNDSEKGRYKMFDDELPQALSCATKHQKGYENKYMRPETIPYLEHTAVNKALEFCEYRPSYLLDPANLKGFGQYHGVYRHVRKTYSFPLPIVDGIMRNQGATHFSSDYPFDEEEAWAVVNRYMDALEKSYSGKYKLGSIKRIEKKEDPDKGVRYLLELLVKDRTDGKSYILSEYVLRPNGKDVPLCYPKGLQWNRTVDVYLILTAKNLGRWVHHFIKNMERIAEETQDEHVHAVIYDFESPDIDLKQALQTSSLKNYHYITKPGRYSRTVSFSEAIESIKNPNAIVVTIDMHLDIGSQFINDIRKHCSRGKTVYGPQIVFLHCGGSSALPRGVWYHLSYGTMAMYKQDWQNFGGFSEAFMKKESWGGEDWDIVDNAVKGGLEIERKRASWVYHYKHDKRGMW